MKIVKTAAQAKQINGKRTAKEEESKNTPSGVHKIENGGFTAVQLVEKVIFDKLNAILQL